MFPKLSKTKKLRKIVRISDKDGGPAAARATRVNEGEGVSAMRPRKFLVVVLVAGFVPGLVHAQSGRSGMSSSSRGGGGSSFGGSGGSGSGFGGSGSGFGGSGSGFGGGGQGMNSGFGQSSGFGMNSGFGNSNMGGSTSFGTSGGSDISPLRSNAGSALSSTLSQRRQGSQQSRAMSSMNRNRGGGGGGGQGMAGLGGLGGMNGQMNGMNRIGPQMYVRPVFTIDIPRATSNAVVTQKNLAESFASFPTPVLPAGSAVNRMSVTVDSGGVATLTGTAANLHHRRLAAAVASLEPGVRGIKNNVQVAPESTPNTLVIPTPAPTQSTIPTPAPGR
jgi:hypothetical protein